MGWIEKSRRTKAARGRRGSGWSRERVGGGGATRGAPARRGAAVVLAVSTLVTADASAQSPVAIGAGLGLGSSTIAWSPSPLGDVLEGLERSTGPSLSGLLRVGGLGPFHLQVEITARDKGFSSAGDPDERTFLDVRYLEVPILLGVELTPEARLVPEVYGGGWIGWEIGCDASIEAPSVAASFDCDATPDGPIERKSTDYGLAAGAALTARDIGPVDLMLDVRWTVGLNNLDGAPDIDNLDIRFRTWSAGLAILRRLSP